MMTTLPVPGEFDDELPLIEAIQGGDRYAFAEFVRRHDPWVRGVIFGVLGKRDRLDDVSQQVWTTVWTRMRDLREKRRWRHWLYRLARNAAFDAGREIARRKERRLASVDNDDLAARMTCDGPPDGGLEAGEGEREVLKAIAGLPPLYREPFVLRHVSGWSYKAIADVMNMPVDSVETRLVRARRFLREALKGQDT